MPLVIHLALSLSRPASRIHKSECYTGAYSWSLHYAHLISMEESVKPVTSMSNLTDNSMYHSLYLPKQYLMPCQSQQLIKWDTSCLIADWTTTGEQRQLLRILTITAKCRSKGMITPSVVRTVWKQRYTLQKQNSSHHFIYLEDYNIQRRMNKQSGFNAEQMKRIIIRRVKPFED